MKRILLPAIFILLLSSTAHTTPVLYDVSGIAFDGSPTPGVVTGSVWIDDQPSQNVEPDLIADIHGWLRYEIGAWELNVDYLGVSSSYSGDSGMITLSFETNGSFNHVVDNLDLYYSPFHGFGFEYIRVQNNGYYDIINNGLSSTIIAESMPVMVDQLSPALVLTAAPVPEPSTLLLLGTGIFGFIAARSKKKR